MQQRQFVERKLPSHDASICEECWQVKKRLVQYWKRSDPVFSVFGGNKDEYLKFAGIAVQKEININFEINLEPVPEYCISKI